MFSMKLILKWFNVNDSDIINYVTYLTEYQLEFDSIIENKVYANWYSNQA